MAASPLTVSAQSNLMVNGTQRGPETGATYVATSTSSAALTVIGTSATGLNGSYSGTHITVSSTFNTAPGAYGVRAYYGGSLALFSSSISTTGSRGYLKVSGVEMISSGGEIRNRTQTARANIDGARTELGAGIIWQLDANNQLHLDCEASFGDKYDKPWGLTVGYRYQF